MRLLSTFLVFLASGLAFAGDCDYVRYTPKLLAHLLTHEVASQGWYVASTAEVMEGKTEPNEMALLNGNRIIGFLRLDNEMVHGKENVFSSTLSVMNVDREPIFIAEEARRSSLYEVKFFEPLDLATSHLSIERSRPYGLSHYVDSQPVKFFDFKIEFDRIWKAMLNTLAAGKSQSIKALLPVENFWFQARHSAVAPYIPYLSLTVRKGIYYFEGTVGSQWAYSQLLDIARAQFGFKTRFHIVIDGRLAPEPVIERLSCDL